MVDEFLLKDEERAIFALRALYKRFGYSSFKMSKFEEYDFYVKNKGFLGSENIITFNDVNGKLMALKPDVTLSIIKNGEDKAGIKQKVYYNENIYRVSERTGQYKEIMQVGIENTGDIDFYDVYEVIFLAAKSLSLISEEFVLDISHMGILASLLDGEDVDGDFMRKVTACLAEKNVHGIEKLCESYRVSTDLAEKICSLASTYGAPTQVLSELEKICDGEEGVKALGELKELAFLMSDSGFGDKVNIDFSVVNNMNYYNGIVFKGFLAGISEGVLAGGQYDGLMHKMHRESGAIGFAIYMDALEDLGGKRDEYDVDTLLIYGESTDISAIKAKVKDITDRGLSVSVQKKIPEGMSCGCVEDLTREEN